MTDPATANDERLIYCRKLGHELHFAYCRTTDGSAPCSRVLDCWFERFDVHGFLAEHLAEEQLALVNQAPPPKVVTLWEMIEAARARTG